MTKAPILVSGEEEHVCILSGIVDGLEELIKHTTLTTWNKTFTEAHNALEAILQERFLYFKDGGALQRLRKKVDKTQIGYKVADGDYTRNGEDTFKCKVSAEDMYSIAEHLQTTNCQNCDKDKSKCWTYSLFRKFDFEKFNENPQKGCCPYAVR